MPDKKALQEFEADTFEGFQRLHKQLARVAVPLVPCRMVDFKEPQVLWPFVFVAMCECRMALAALGKEAVLRAISHAKLGPQRGMVRIEVASVGFLAKSYILNLKPDYHALCCVIICL